jgi:glycosyltransferase involved in cell wall biosynthesis
MTGKQPQHPKQNLVSVIIPCYNQGKFLQECIESVLNQTYRSLEIIIVDDGSTDDTRDVARRFPVLKYVHQNNAGPAQARNNGFNVSTGNYLIFLDADDRLLPNGIEENLNFLNRNPDSVFVSGQIRMIAENGSFMNTPEITCVLANHYRTLLESNYIWTTGCVMFRRSIFESFQFDKEFLGPEDWKLYLCIARKHPVCSHANVIVEHRMHKGKLTGNAALLLRDSLNMLRQEWDFVRGNKEYELALREGIKATRAYWSRPLILQIIDQFQTHQWTKAVQNLRALIRYHPSGFVKAFTPRYLAILFGINPHSVKKMAANS